MQEKCLQNKRTSYYQRLTGTLSRMSLFTEFFINKILFIHIPATLWDFSYVILKIESETLKTQQLLRNARSTVRKQLIFPYPNSH